MYQDAKKKSKKRTALNQSASILEIISSIHWLLTLIPTAEGTSYPPTHRPFVSVKEKDIIDEMMVTSFIIRFSILKRGI